MAFERIDRLVTKEGFCFQAWEDRYGLGVWAALGMLENQVDTVRDLSSSGDLDRIPAMEYVESADWLPFATGATLLEAMQHLEERLASLPQDQLHRESPWSRLVFDAITALESATRNRSNYRDEHERQQLPLEALPATFGLALEQLSRAYLG
jgi:hypothetical protein